MPGSVVGGAKTMRLSPRTAFGLALKNSKHRRLLPVFTWITAGGGDFNAGANWDRGTAPGPNDEADMLRESSKRVILRAKPCAPVYRRCNDSVTVRTSLKQTGIKVSFCKSNLPNGLASSASVVHYGWHARCISPELVSPRRRCRSGTIFCRVAHGNRKASSFAVFSRKMSGKNLMPPVPGGRGLRRKTLGLSTPRTAGETVYEVEFVSILENE